MRTPRKIVLFYALMLLPVLITGGTALTLGYQRVKWKMALAGWPMRWRYIKYYCAHPAARELADEVTETVETGIFWTVWNGGAGINLSRKLYSQVDMFGQRKFRYKPGVVKFTFAKDIGVGYLVNYEIPEARNTRAMLERLKPDYLSEAHYDLQGFRDSALPERRDLGRIVFLGDSFVDGYGVNDDETLTHHFGLLSIPAGYGVPVNTGVGGYSTLEEYYTLLKALNWVPGVRMVVLVHHPTDVDPDQAAVLEDRVPDREAKWAESLLWLEKACTVCRSRKIPFVLAAIPTAYQLRSEVKSRTYQERLRSFAEENGVLFLDPTEAMAALGPEKTFLAWDTHYSPEGNRVLAETLWKAVRKRHPSLK